MQVTYFILDTTDADVLEMLRVCPVEELVLESANMITGSFMKVIGECGKKLRVLRIRSIRFMTNVFEGAATMHNLEVLEINSLLYGSRASDILIELALTVAPNLKTFAFNSIPHEIK
jgi:hypothetical protein